MRKLGLVLFTVILFGVGCSPPLRGGAPPLSGGQGSVAVTTPSAQPLNLKPEISMKIQSPAFGHQQTIPKKYTCDGEDVSPPLEFVDVPAGAKSLALISDDPDAQQVVGYTWVHFTLWNIAPSVREIAEGSVPSGAVQGVTSFGKSGYGGPCPPSGTHRYYFKIYALDTVLDLPATIDAKGLEAAMDGHILDRAEMVGLYERQ